jgi:hypothetical protein
MAELKAIKYQRGKLDVLDQLRLPHEFLYDNVSTCEEAFDCIKSMRVRGNSQNSARENVEETDPVLRCTSHCNRGSPRFSRRIGAQEGRYGAELAI